MRFKVSSQAEREIDEIFLYWAKRAGLDVADRLVEAIEAQFAILGEYPHIGRKCDQIAPGIRSFPAGNYLIYYRHTRGVTSILHVFHGARDQGKAFRTS
jgi:toxin ParE1/3/4